MTHDELLAYINEEIEVCDPSCNSHKADNQPWLALRAVVELLKEYSDGQVRVNEEFNQGVLALSNVIKEVIEKELLQCGATLSGIKLH